MQEQGGCERFFNIFSFAENRDDDALIDPSVSRLCRLPALAEFPIIDFYRALELIGLLNKKGGQIFSMVSSRPGKGFFLSSVGRN